MTSIYPKIVLPLLLAALPLTAFSEIEKSKLIKQSGVFQTDGNSSSAKIYIGASDDGGVTTAREFIYSKVVSIEGLIEVASDDVGKAGDIFVVMRKGSAGSKRFYALNESGVWESWGGSLKNLPIAKSVSSLSESERVEVFSGKIELGQVAIYLGYATQSSGSKPIIHVHASPQKYISIDANGSEGISFSSKFSTISVDLDDYPKAENPSLTLQMVSLVDLNADGKKDIVAHYWHNIWDAGSDYYEPVPNKVIAFLQGDDQIFANSNIEVFGEENVDLFGGASRKQTLGDFNYDGYIDIAYAMNREDGRPGVYPGTPNWGSYPAILLSNKDGTYSVSQPGNEKIWYHAVASIPNDLGYDDILYRPVNYGEPPLAYRFEETQWVTISDYPPIDGWEIQAVKNKIWSTETHAVELYLKSYDGWNSVGRIEYPASSDDVVEVVTWAGDLSRQNIRNIIGRDRVAVAFSESCIIDNGRYYVTQLDSRLLPENWRDFDNVKEIELTMDKPLLIFEYMDGQIIQKEDLFTNQQSLRHSYRYICADYNSDSLDDIFVSTNDGSSLLYIQAANGNFELQNEDVFPKANSFQNMNSVRSILEDINDDGKYDLIYYSNTPSASSKKVNFEIHWGD